MSLRTQSRPDVSPREPPPTQIVPKMRMVFPYIGMAEASNKALNTFAHNRLFRGLWRWELEMHWTRTVFAVFVCSFFVSTAHATLLVYDGFEYALGQNLSGQNNAAYSRTWDHTGSTNNANLFSTIGSASLAVPIGGSPGNDLLAKHPSAPPRSASGLAQPSIPTAQRITRWRLR